MKHPWKGAVALVFLGALALLHGPGCVQAEAPFYIKGAKFAPCAAASCESSDLLRGTLDVRYTCQYIARLELGNQLVRRGDETKLQLETSRVSVTAFDVEILDAAGEPFQHAGGDAAFTFATTGFIDPSVGTSPGCGIAAAQLVDGATAQALKQQTPPGSVTTIIARVTAHGRTLGGLELVSRPFDFPIDVCVGCACSEPADDDCVSPQSAPKANQCASAQDNVFDCRLLGGHSCDEPTNSCGVTG